MILLVQYTLIFASVLSLVALGGCFSEHSGVINLGLEGIMVMGALGGALAMKYMPESAGAFQIIVAVILCAVIAGMIYSLLLGVACINFSADQTLIGTAMNLMATALATVIVKTINTAENPDNVSSTIQYVNQKQAFIHRIGDFEFNWFMGADATETVEAVEDAADNREQDVSGPEQIESWTKFTFPGRRGRYSTFTWDHTCFDGTDWDEEGHHSAIYRFQDKQWEKNVDSEDGNYDYLMGCDLDMSLKK